MNQSEIDQHTESILAEGWISNHHGDAFYNMLQIMPADDWWCLVKEDMEDGKVQLFEVPVMSFALCETLDVDSLAGDAYIHKGKSVVPVLQNFAADDAGVEGEPYFKHFFGDFGEVIKLYRKEGNHGHSDVCSV